MHFGIKVRVAVFTVIRYAKRFNLGRLKNRVNRTSMDCRESCITSSFGVIINMWCQFWISPCFCRVTEITRFLTGDIYDPSLFFISNFGITSSSGQIEQSIFHSTLDVFAQTEHYAFPIDAYFIGNIVNRMPVCFQKQDASPVVYLRLDCSSVRLSFQIHTFSCCKIYDTWFPPHDKLPPLLNGTIIT